MSFDQPKVRTKRSGIDHEEERAWVGFYRRVHSDASVAAEVMAQLDTDPEMKRRHLALYLCCRQSLRMSKARQQRDKRIGQFVRWLCHGMFVVPIRALRRGGQVVVECLPEATREPAAAKVRKLAADPEFAKAHSAFQQQAAGSIAGAGAASDRTQADTDLSAGQRSA